MSNVGRRILLVDDDEQLVGLLSIRLGKAGYNVTSATRSDMGYHLGLSGEHDVIVLDIVMPKMNGLELCAQLRERGIVTPILVLSGQTDTGIVVQGLNAGADDYLTKPFSDVELLARLKALLRRSHKAFMSQSISRYDLALDIPGRTIRRGDEVTSLTYKEALLLKRLMAEAPKPVSRISLLQDVWGIGGSHASNRLDVYVRRLRQKLAAIGGHGYIQTLRSGGYYLADPVSSKTSAIT